MIAMHTYSRFAHSVISTSAAQQMIQTLGHIECPATGQLHSMSDLKRCYIS